MAAEAEVPVSDILCEAMEYLSKLGSNLRTRSENLKEKRISKNKLKNSHAVQKAASKVLLICELSRKSLDNVETGVRKVLSLLETSQASSSIGGRSHVKDRESKKKYHYFEYKSKKLRIAKKIPLKHYMSVKVLATPMPSSMQDKYPVYYNCKLKRKREAVTQKSKQRRRSDSYSDKEQECVNIDSSDDEEADRDKTENSTGTDVDKSDKKSPKTGSESRDPKCENDKVNMSVDDSVVEIKDKASHKEGSDTDHDGLTKLSRKGTIDSSDNDNSNPKISENKLPINTEEQKQKKTNKSDKDKNKKANRIRFADVYSSDSDKESQKEENVDDTVSSEHEPESKKLKLINDDSNSQLDSDGGAKPSLKSKENEVSDNGSQSKQESDNDSTKSKNCESGGETKPLIRCVNLSKLLKPDLLKNEPLMKNNKSSFTKNSTVEKKKDRNYMKDKISKRKKENDEFWAQKRKEVSEFKSKNFSINIDRLPNLTVSFLLANNLKKIVKRGRVICEVSNESVTPNKIKAVKNALLIDSESDDGGENDNTSKVKESHLNYSDSNHNSSDEKKRKKSNKLPDENEQNERASPELEKVTDDNCASQPESNNDNTKENSKGNKKNTSTEKNQNHSSDDEHIQSDTNIPETFNDSSDDFAGFNKSDIESPSKIRNTIKSFLLNDSSDEKSDKNEDDSHTKANQKSKSSLLNEIDEKSNKNENDLHKIRQRLAKANEKSKSSLLNDSSDEKSNKSEDESHTKANKKSKSLLNESSDEKSNKNDEDSHIKVNKNSKCSQLNESSDKNSNKSEDDSHTKANEKSNESEDDSHTKANEISKSFLNESSDEKSNKSEDDSHTKANKKSKPSLLNESSDDKSNKSEDDSRKKANKKSKSSLLNESSDDKSNKSEDDSRKKVNEKSKSSLLNESSDDKSNKSEDNSRKKVNEKSKSSLLNESSDDKSNKSEDDSHKKVNEKSKSSLLNESSDDKSNKSEDNSHKKVNEKSKSSLLNESSDDKSNKSEDDSHKKVNEKSKSSLLNESSDDKSKKNGDESHTKSDENPKSPVSNDSSHEKSNKNEEDSLTKTNEKSKSSLLNDSSDEKSNKNEEESPTKATEKLKSALLNDSSDVKSDESDDGREKQKTPKAKRKHARKSREAQKKLKFDSSSESEQEIPRQCRRKRSHVVNTSPSSEDTKKKKKKQKSKLDSSTSSDNKSIDQIDGAVDEHSNSSVKKMVRSKAKPSGSSSQNSDNQDASDKDIDGLTNLNSLNKIRRRDTSGKSRDGDRKREKKTRSNPTPIIGEDLLKSESSSEVSDDGQNDIDEELPPVTLPGLNGDTLDHIAKDDLLGESDSSISHNDKEQSENPSNSDDEANVKSKRRKANAISSDSEGGSNRRKIKDDVKMSDFEDSETESSEPVKKAKRKTRVTDSDASVDSNDEGKKKRRRIKIVKDSDASGSDTENEGRNKHGRKNIRKVMGKNQLEEATKKAAREEKERIARISERQKLYNNLDFDESGKPDEVVLEKVVLDFDPETKEPLIEVDRGLVKKLKPHQANGIKFMWDACFESVKRIKKDRGSGCILAHCMGLGKTLQVISLTHTLLTHGELTGVNRVLVVCPLSTVLNWVNEFKMWLKHAVADFEVDVYELSRYKQNSERAFQLQQWFDGGGVCVLGYEMFRNLSADNNKKFKKKMLKSFQESLVEPGPDLVVCDEGHLLKNEKTSLSQSMNKVKTRRRIVLTGTPLQNNLKEYYCMVQFVKPNLLGKYNEYLNRFVNPITNGQYTDSTEHDIRVMKRRSHVLHKMLDGAVQRRDYGVLAPFLPPKHEYVLFITLSEVQIKLYQFYLDNYSRRPLPGKSSGFLFPDFQSLQRIWTHPLVLKYNSERYEIMQQKKRDKEEEDSEGSLVDFIDDDSTPDESSTEESSDDLSDMSDDSRKKGKKKKSAKKSKGKDSKASTRRGTRANPGTLELEEEDNEGDGDVVEVKNENPTEWWIKLVEETELEDMRNSHKLVLLFDILRQCETIGDKLLVFSQSLYSLDLIEHFLGKVDEATQEGRIDEKLGGHVGSWSPGVDYFRLDGSTSCENRSIWCKNFNREDNPRARLFLISTRAGGLGINLVAANRVVIFDVSWNPSHDVQSIFRVYRFGQKKPCYVYRFLAMGTMEEKIYERQVTKQAISKRVIDEQQIDRHYAENDLAELYKFEAVPNEPRPLPTLPKDRLFAEMLKEHEAQIYKYHEHDSLLENKEEETLSEEERKAAWEDFENEKNKPPPAPFPSAWPMHNGMVPGLLAQQQQQLAYAALAAMLRKDMPNINDNQIRDMLPLIYNSNPGLMQKMGDIYKYAQPGMMNPGMMNAVMNAGTGGGAGGGGGALGGSSGLQYEPPWQRQQQQQQQMRLQQLMQHQNQMGAKFYAGGLGSRDPIAMALQQQRAREIMMGGGAGRPRGRPPLHARPPTTEQDVVNLDSD